MLEGGTCTLARLKSHPLWQVKLPAEGDDAAEPSEVERLWRRQHELSADVCLHRQRGQQCTNAMNCHLGIRCIEQMMLTGPILAHWDIITAMIRQTSLVRALLEGGRVLVGLLVPETATDGLRDVFLLRSKPKPPVGKRDSWIDQEQDESDSQSSSSSGDVINRPIPMPSCLRNTSTMMDPGSDEHRMSPSTKRRKVGDEVPQVLSDSDGLEIEDTPPSVKGFSAMAPKEPAKGHSQRHHYARPVNMVSIHAPASNSLSSAMPQQQQLQQQQQQQQCKQQNLDAASLGTMEKMSTPCRTLRSAFLDVGRPQELSCHPGNVGGAQTTATKVTRGSAFGDAATTPALSDDPRGQQQGPNGTVQLDASARLAAIKARMAERRRLQEERSMAETPGVPVTKPVCLGHPMDMVEPPPKYLNAWPSY